MKKLFSRLAGGHVKTDNSAKREIILLDISGLAVKTSYAMFLMKSMQEKFSDCAFVIFNVKGKDLLAIHKPNDENIEPDYKSLGLSSKPFEKVRYYAPRNKNGKITSYLSQDDAEEYLAEGIMKRFAYTYKKDRASIEMLFSDIDDPTQTMDSIISKIIDSDESDFKDISTWENFLEKVYKLSKKSNDGNSKEITVLSWRKFYRIVNKAIKNDQMFVDRPIPEEHECRLAEELKKISAGSVSVIDIAKLSTGKQAFVFGDVLKTIYDLKLGEYDITPPSKVIIFVDELNKFASKDTTKNSPILRQILDVAERGRSLGIILFGAEQFRSNIHSRVTGNCSTLAFGRTNVLETTTRACW